MLHGVVSDIKLPHTSTPNRIHPGFNKFSVVCDHGFIKGKGRQSEILDQLCACARLALVLKRTMINKTWCDQVTLAFLGVCYWLKVS